MEIFTVTQLQRQMSDILNKVQSDGLAGIVNRQRPKMIIMTEEKYLSLVGEKASITLEVGGDNE